MNNIIHSLYFADRNQQALTHYHDCHQILFVTCGTCRVRINAEEKTACKGNIIVISRFEEHSISDASDDYQRYVLRVLPHGDYGETPKLYSLLFNRPEHFNNVLQTSADFENIRHLFDWLLHEYTAKNQMKNEMLELLLEELLIFICRHAPLTLSALDASGFEIIAEVQNLLSSEFGESYTLGTLASRFCVSPSFLSHRFKKITGVSVMEFLFSCRIAEAKRMLVKTDLPVGKIMEKCGFSDFSNFCRIFKKSTGLSPTEYAAHYKNL